MDKVRYIQKDDELIELINDKHYKNNLLTVMYIESTNIINKLAYQLLIHIITKIIKTRLSIIIIDENCIPLIAHIT